LSKEIGLIDIFSRSRARTGANVVRTRRSQRVFKRVAATTMLEDLQIMMSICVRFVRESCGVVKEWEVDGAGVTQTDQHLEWKSSESAGERTEQTRWCL
jgi:hypothetical protein